MIGQTIAHYEILEKLGEGGMGVVYKARDTHLDRFVAIKVLPPGRVSDPERKRRFVQEAKAASALNHPNIITIHDIAQGEVGQASRPVTPGGSPGPPHLIDFIVMEYVAGKTLDQFIGRKGLKLSETLKCSIQIADALAAAHGAGIVHRDLKPGNVMVNESGLVKVLDFGLAKLMEPLTGELAPTQTLKPHTEEGKIVGTVAYMSPEQAEGKPVDARSDIFSFGAVLYEMVTGHKAFQRDTQASTLAAILREEPKPASQVGVEVPRDLEKIIARCLRKERERRYQHMADVKLALEEVKEESDSGALAEAPPLRRRRRRGLLWAAGGFALLLALGAGVRLVLLRQAPTPAPVLKPLTSDPGREYHPSFSPEGTQVAYAWNGEKQDNFDIYVKLIDSGARLRLTTDAADEYSPAWSPDGRWIAFLRALPGGRNGVFLISPLGGPERKLAEIRTPGMWWVEAQGPYLAWFPDSKWLAFVDQSSPAEPYALFLLSVETLERRRLTAPPVPLSGDLDAAFSPDGHTLAFIRHPGWGSGDLYLLPLTADLRPGGETKRLTSEARFAANPIWVPGGREIVFISGASYLDPSLWRIGVSGAGKPERLQSLGAGIRFPAISRQGRRLAFARLSTDSNIWRAELAQPGGRASASVSLIASTRIDWAPDYSPDGKKISFISDRSGNFEVWVCDSDGSNPVPLASLGDMFTFFTRWSPDGRRILFVSTAEGQREIYVIDAQGGQPRRLTNHPAHDTHPRWSRDGKWIYFSSSRSGEEQT